MPSKKAVKLFERIQNSTSGWTSRDLRRLYTGYGFEEVSQKGSHIVVKHPEYPDLRAVIADHSGELATGYAVTARRLINKLLELESSEEDPDE